MTTLVQRFCRRVSRNSTTEEEPTRIENILVNDVTTPKRSFTSRLHSPENIGMTVIRMESTDTLDTPDQPRVKLYLYKLFSFYCLKLLCIYEELMS